MIQYNFYVSNENRMNIVKSFIRKNMPTARFIYNPYKHLDNRWSFYISYEIEDMNKINKILQEFYLEDHPPSIKKENFLKQIIRKAYKILCNQN